MKKYLYSLLLLNIQLLAIGIEDYSPKKTDFIFLILIFLIIGLVHNIYLRIQTENKLKQRVEFDSLLLNTIESPIFWQDNEGKIIDSNEKFCSFINLSCDEMYGNFLNDFEDNTKIKFLIRVLHRYKENKEEYAHFSFKDKNNEKKIYFIKQASYYDKKNKKSGSVTIFTDVTKEKIIEKEREKNKQFIIQQSKLAEIGEIFSSIAHQWKSPLVEISTIAQERFYTSNNNMKESESYVKDIMTQIEYMNKTIDDFQNFIMPSNTKQIFDVKEAIDSILKIVNHNIKYNYIKINMEINKDTNLMVYGFKNEFMQSFLNIINNAKDELLKNDLKNRYININFFNKDNNLVIEVQDNAGGIKINNLKKIFKPYYSTKKDGHGIGLYMAKVIIEDKMNGKLSVRNMNNGLSFEIVLGNVA